MARKRHALPLPRGFPKERHASLAPVAPALARAEHSCSDGGYWPPRLLAPAVSIGKALWDRATTGGIVVGTVSLPITGVVLAGGAGRRMGGLDKGFVLWSGEPLVVHALRFMAGLPQVLISANRSLSRYRALGYEVVTDECADFSGPLMGLRAALRKATQLWTACLPVDSPCLPADIMARLWAARVAGGIVVGRSPQGPEPIVCLVWTALLPHLETYLAKGGLRAQDWFRGLPQAWLDLTAAEAANCNTPQDLR